MLQLKAKKKPNAGLDKDTKDGLDFAGSLFQGFFDFCAWVDKNPALGGIASKLGGVSKLAEMIQTLMSIDFKSEMQGALVGQSDTIAKWKEYLRTDWSGDYVDIGPLIEAIIQGAGELITIFYPPAKPIVDAIKYAYAGLKSVLNLVMNALYVKCG